MTNLSKEILTLEDFAQQLPSLKTAAKARWGERVPAAPTPPVSASGLKAGQSMIVSASPPKNLGGQYHLQQMVIADDPIKYLGENI